MKRTALCFLIDRKQGALLMIHKKRGQGAGKWNVPGGKLRDGETAAAAAVRETQEETGLTPLHPKAVGELEFRFAGGNNWENSCTVFLAEAFTGALIAETNECTAHWIPLAEIPYAKMWECDQRWVPLVLAGKPFQRAYTFDAEDRVVDEKIVR